MHQFIYPVIHTHIHSTIRSYTLIQLNPSIYPCFIYSFIHLPSINPYTFINSSVLIYLSIPLSIYSTYPCICITTFIHSLFHSSVCIHLFIHQLIYSCIHVFIYSAVNVQILILHPYKFAYSLIHPYIFASLHQ